MNNNPFSLAGKTILVTGASSGIGREIAIQCSRMGARIILIGRDHTRIRETYKQLEGNDHEQLIVDLSKSAEIEILVKSIDPLDGVVHCAGVSRRLPLKFIRENTLVDLLQINFLAPALLTQKLYSAKKINNHASLVYISSVASNYATVGSIMYMSSKGALNSFVKGVANELAPQGIRANAIQPGMIVTKMNNSIPDEEIQKDLANYPLGRYGKPEEVAWAAVYLLSDATKWMTGSILTIDGGLTLR